jgi:ribosomal protein L18
LIFGYKNFKILLLLKMQNLKSQAKDKVRKFARRKIRINTQIKAVNPDYRVIVNRSNMYVTAQVLDIN